MFLFNNKNFSLCKRIISPKFYIIMFNPDCINNYNIAVLGCIVQAVFNET